MMPLALQCRPDFTSFYFVSILGLEIGVCMCGQTLWFNGLHVINLLFAYVCAETSRSMVCVQLFYSFYNCDFGPEKILRCVYACICTSVCLCVLLIGRSMVRLGTICRLA